jgi:hypothetical protein
VRRIKLSRKQRAAAARTVAARSLSQEQIGKDFLTDGQARFKACLWAISLTFAYGVINNVILGRSESQVSLEALGVCIVTVAFRIAIFYSDTARSRLRHGIAERLWMAGKYVAHQRFGRTIGVSAIALVLVLNALPLEAVEPTIATWVLKRSNAGLIPVVDSDLRGTHPAYRFREVSGRIERSIDAKAQSDPNTVSNVRNSLARILENVRLPENVATAAKLELAYLQSYETLSRMDPRSLHQVSSVYAPGIPAVIGAGIDKTRFILLPPAPEFTEQDATPKFFSGFTVISFGHNPGSPVPQFAVSKSNDTEVVFNEIGIQGLAQDIGSFTWTNVTFQGCLIRYHGQPVRMGNVRFFNCTFERSPDGKGQQLLDFLSTHQGEPVSAYVP